VPEKRKIAQAAAESGAARARALGLPDRPDVSALASQLGALASRSDLVVEWRVTDVAQVSASAAVSCACCCCCCCIVTQ
jgi:hypothetical protein